MRKRRKGVGKGTQDKLKKCEKALCCTLRNSTSKMCVRVSGGCLCGVSAGGQQNNPSKILSEEEVSGGRTTSPRAPLNIIITLY